MDHTDLDSVDEAKFLLERQIKHVMANPDDIDSPISVSLELKAMRASGEPMGEVLADMQEKLAALEGNVDKIEADMTALSNPESFLNRLDKMDAINNKLNLIIAALDLNKDDL